jgi:hypothetical protein
MESSTEIIGPFRAAPKSLLKVGAGLPVCLQRFAETRSAAGAGP